MHLAKFPGVYYRKNRHLCPQCISCLQSDPSKEVPTAAVKPNSQRVYITKVPANFDWQVYLEYYPELRRKAIDTEAKAKHHYITHGYDKGLVYTKFRIIVRYTACTGLINQQYSHIAAFALAAALDSELVLPPAVQRNSFGKYFSMEKSRNHMKWTPARLDTLLDVDAVIEAWHNDGMTIHRVSITSCAESEMKCLAVTPCWQPTSSVRNTSACLAISVADSRIGAIPGSCTARHCISFIRPAGS